MKFNFTSADIPFDVGDTVWIRYGLNSNSMKNWRKVEITKIRFKAERCSYDRGGDSNDIYLNVMYDVRWKTGEINTKNGRPVYKARTNVPWYVVSGDDGDGPTMYKQAIESKKKQIEKLQQELKALEGEN